MPKQKTAPSPLLPKLLFRREEAAFSLGLSVREIDRMVSERHLSTRRYGKCILIPSRDIEHVRDLIERDQMLEGAYSPSAKPLSPGSDSGRR